ncbi:MAG: hypothetical protein NTZ13_02680 [Candidatus Parcubacteria bacterium]|nr:hypothetical protein [Candidatus Parcubacteria bacterium]
MAKFTEKSSWDGQEITYTWLPTSDIKKYVPVAQVYGVCIDDEGKILVIKDKRWQIPGGTPEKGELFYQYRYLAMIIKINPTQPDPATGREYERKFVSFDEIDEYVKWGSVGTEMFKDAGSLSKKL